MCMCVQRLCTCVMRLLRWRGTPQLDGRGLLPPYASCPLRCVSRCIVLVHRAVSCRVVQIRHAQLSYGIDAEPVTAVAPLQSFRSLAYVRCPSLTPASYVA